MNLEELPEELLVEQLMTLPVKDILGARQTDRLFAKICERRDLWYRLIQRDFPWYPLPPLSKIPDPKALYIQIPEKLRVHRQEIMKTPRYREAANSAPGDFFWNADLRSHWRLVGNPLNYSEGQGYDRFVFWLDYRVADTVNGIVNRFIQDGITTVLVGELYRLSDGRMGDPPGEYPLSPQIIYRNSLDPLDPNQQQFINDLGERMREEFQPVGVSVQEIQEVINRYPNTPEGFREAKHEIMMRFGLSPRYASDLLNGYWQFE